MDEILVCYSFEKINPVARKKFDRELFGSIEKTHGGKYKTKIKGVLTDKKYKKPVRSVLVFETKYKDLVLNVLNKFGANIQVYKICK